MSIKPKICNKNGCTQHRWARGLCLSHDKQEDPERYKLKRSVKKIKPVSDKMHEKLKVYRKRRDLHFKKHPRCQFPECNAPETDRDLHHKNGRQGSFLTDKRYFVTLCRYHHQWVHENPVEAVKLKLLGSQISINI